MPTNYKALVMPSTSKVFVANLDTGEIINTIFLDKFMAEEWIKHQHKLQDVKLFLVETPPLLQETFLIRARLKIEAINLAKNHPVRSKRFDSDETDWEAHFKCKEISLNHHDDPRVLLYAKGV